MIDRAQEVSRQVDILRSTGELSPAELEALGIRLQEYADETAKPLSVHVLLGMGGWCCAIFLMLIAQFVLQGKGLLPCGLVSLMAAVGLSRVCKGTFASHLALALAVAGNMGILTSVASVIRGDATVAIPVLQLFICLLLYPLLSNAAFRFAAPFSVAALAFVWIFESSALWLFHLLVGAELILWVRMTARGQMIPAYIPLEKAMALLLPLTLVVFHLARIVYHALPSATPLWPSGLFAGVGLIIILFHPSTGLPNLPLYWKIWLSAAVLLLGLFTSPGIPAALMLLILGKSRRELYLTVLGWLFLSVFLGFYYDGLDIGSGNKAWVIAGSGVLLLAMRRLAVHFRPGESMP